jgi:hypothetical protein
VLVVCNAAPTEQLVRMDLKHRGLDQRQLRDALGGDFACPVHGQILEVPVPARTARWLTPA